MGVETLGVSLELRTTDGYVSGIGQPVRIDGVPRFAYGRDVIGVSPPEYADGSVPSARKRRHRLIRLRIGVPYSLRHHCCKEFRWS